jgi:D-lactate dehydrogenase (cytochrome)
MPDWLAQIQRLLPGDRVSMRGPDLEAAGRDESTLPPVLPEAVAWPLETEEVAAIIRMAAAHGVPVTARGGGSSLEGNPIPVRRGLVVDLSRMDRIVEVHSADLLVRVQPGVIYDRLNRELRPHGLFFPPHPGGSAEIATIGGMVANNASGIYAVGYGGTRDYVRAATVVTGTGEVVRLGSRCPKVSSGYHLIGLLVGSEGTLGIATEITLALAPLPSARRRLAVRFTSERDAAAAIALMMRYGVALAAVEFMDRRCVAAVNRLLGTQVDEIPLILIELHAAEILLGEQEETVRTLCAEHGGSPLADAGEAWSLRHQVTRAIQAAQPEAQIVRTDLAFPVSCLPEVVERAYDLARARQAVVHTFGHAGLGILHVLVLAQRRDTAAWDNAGALKDELIAYVLTLGGSISGEHGLGLGNRKYAALEHGTTLPLMRAIKDAFDPHGILNPGKLWE